MNVQPITLVGREIRLEPLALEHSNALLTHAEASIFQYLTPPQAYTREGFRVYVEGILKRPNMLPFAIVHNADETPIGMTSYLDIRPEHSGLEVGFTWISDTYQGTNVNPEAKYLMLQHAFERLGALRVQLKTDSRNTQSQRAIEKLGAVKEGVLRNHMIMSDGHVRNTVMYSILQREWHTQVKPTLQARLGYAL